ncbi:hypothetical protein G7Y89_g2316 [Cudoniella acicularis]|uniref:Zn(2)-C6 fungal-type domain-containing protein n=1 Tax=Cudoniella acicularis TaxID=354080 RepID=A0A8H4RUC9_9HELO|nr:hypothetical protein G7Y89_g2316 [Cudoniella acicularis]
MPSRRTHTKSRTGCIKCKSSKVKCDEKRPSCSRCLRRQESCQYPNAFLSSYQIPSPSSNPLSPQSLVHGPAVPQIPEHFWNAAFPYWGSSSSEGEQVTFNDFRDRDLELLHHYSTSTYLTLASRVSLDEFWKIVMVKIAFSNPFLMHGLLALSACHLAHLRTEDSEHYSNIAIHHHAEAISIFRPLLNNVDSQTAVPAVAFSTVIGCLSFAMPGISHLQELPSAGPTFVKNLLDIFRLVRGVKVVLESTFQWVEDSPMAPLLKLKLNDSEEPLEFNAEVAVREIEAKIRSEVHSEEQRLDYLDAVTVFRRCFPRGPFDFEDQDRSLISAWPAMVRDTFFADMLEMKIGFPLVILGYYGVLMHFMSSSWWVKDKGNKLVEAVSKLSKLVALRNCSQIEFVKEDGEMSLYRKEDSVFCA